jgi:hypothetical protein
MMNVSNFLSSKFCILQTTSRSSPRGTCECPQLTRSNSEGATLKARNFVFPNISWHMIPGLKEDGEEWERNM